MLDLNGFKQINDRHGHLAGDELLRQFAGELRRLRAWAILWDAGGGDEFVVLLSCDAAGARLHTNRIREWVFGKYTLEGGEGKKPLEVRVEATMGLAEWHAGDTMEQVIASADAAMYHDKKKLTHA